MLTYLVTATHPNGKRDTFPREAASMLHLRQVLEREGFTDIELVDDDITARLRAERPDNAKPQNLQQYRFEARLHKGPDDGAFWATALMSNKWPLLIGGAVAAYGLWKGLWVLVVLGVATISFVLWVVRKAKGGADAYQELMKAIARGEWDRASALCDDVLALPSAQNNAQIEQDITARRAMVLAAKGQLPSALNLWDTHRAESGAGAIDGMHENRRAGINYIGGDYAGAIADMERGYEASRHSTLMRFDLAQIHARVGDAARARELAGGIDQRELNALQLAVLPFVDGQCALREGRLDIALQELGRADAGLATYAANPVIWPFVGIIKASLAKAMLASGRRDEAVAVIAPWKQVIGTVTDAATRDELRQAGLL